MIPHRPDCSILDIPKWGCNCDIPERLWAGRFAFAKPITPPVKNKRR